MKAKRLLWLAGLALAALPLSSVNANPSLEGCAGRNSWLVPSACTYCEWGGSCGSCQISGCTANLT
jgi:hypothetical protein